LYVHKHLFYNCIRFYLNINDFSVGTYSNVFPSTSADATDDRCYYNFDDNQRKPDTAISVEDLPDVVLQPEFRLELDKQFEVGLTPNNDFETEQNAL